MAAPRFIAISTADLPELIAFAQTLTPRLQVCPPDALILEVSRRQESDVIKRIQAFSTRVGYGSSLSRNCALLAAKYRPGTLLEQGQEAGFLAAIPVSAFSLLGDVSEEILGTLDRWGIRTLGQLAALPGPELASRLGEEGSRLHKIAGGQDLVPFQSHSPERRFEESENFDYSLNALEPLSFVLGGVIERLCADLQSRGLAAETIRVELKLESGASYSREVGLAVPLAHPKVLLSLVRLDLQSHPPVGRVVGVSVRLMSAPPRIFQHSLFEPLVPAPEKLARTLGRLAALVGEKNVGSPVLLDTHRPDAFELVPFEVSRRDAEKAQRLGVKPSSGVCLALRRFRPAVPVRLRSDQIAVWAGPWLSSGDWWNEKQWAREEWDIEFAGGTVYRVYFDLQLKKWFLDGVYD